MKIQNQFSYYSNRSTDQVLTDLETSPAGLTDAQVGERSKIYGLNVLQDQTASWWQILVRQWRSPFIYMLFIVAIFAFFLHNTLEGAVIIAIVLLNTLFGFYQEFKAEKTIQLLKRYVAARTTVVRNGTEQTILRAALVPGDIVLLYPGDSIPADVRIIEAQHVTVDESSLTGEVVPVQKTDQALAHVSADMFTAANSGFAGTTVLTGKAVGVVFATGMFSSLGKLAALVNQTVRVSNLSKIIGRFSRFIVYLMGISLTVIFVVHLLLKQARVDLIELILFVSALAISVIPEALPLVITFALSRGAVRLANKKTVVKRLSAIEDLGNIQILCTDKTGTLTENILTVADVYGSDPQKALVYATLAGYKPTKKGIITKGFDVACYQKLSESDQKLVQAHKQINEVPFDPTRLTTAVLVAHEATTDVIIRGAHEVVMAQCSSIPDRERIQEWLHDQGVKGNRALAVAYKPGNQQTDLIKQVEQDQFIFLGLIAFTDPIKKTVPGALKKAHELGLELKILSGDSKEVCGAVAYQLGLITDSNQVLTGAEFAQAPEDEQRQLVIAHTVFARVLPEHKQKIIKLLQEKQDVGYLGDGINDVPALKEAHVGIVVDDAVDIAREVADIILLKKSLMVVVEGIGEGRRVFANTMKYLRTTLSASFGNFYSVGLASLILNFLPMLPIQILLANFLSDAPLITIATDTVNPQELKRPEQYDVHGILVLALMLGVVSTVFDFIFFAFFFYQPAGVLQTGWFVESIIGELAFIFSIRTNRFFLKGGMPSLALMLTSCFVAILAVGMAYTAVGHYLFELVPLKKHQLAVIGAIVAGYFVVTELVKCIYMWLQTKNTRMHGKV